MRRLLKIIALLSKMKSIMSSSNTIKEQIKFTVDGTKDIFRRFESLRTIAFVSMSLFRMNFLQKLIKKFINLDGEVGLVSR